MRINGIYICHDLSIKLEIAQQFTSESTHNAKVALSEGIHMTFL